MKLTIYQQEAVQATIDYLRIYPAKNPLVTMATGTGKSIVIAELIRRLTRANPNIRTIVATHVAELVSQNHDKLKAIWPEAQASIFSAGLGVKDKSKQIVFAGLQSIYAQDMGHIKLLIIDEAHTIGRESQMWHSLFRNLKSKNPKLRIVGFSATPFRLDSGNLTYGEDAMFDDVIYEYGLGEAVKDGYLTSLVPKGMKTPYDISGVGKQAGEYKLKELEAATNLDHLTQSAVQEIIEYGQGRKSWLIFCNGVDHSYAVRNALRAKNVSCETITGETTNLDREHALREFRLGNLRSLTNFGTLTTGVDVPSVDLIGMLRHTMSGGLLLQMAGRGTRVVIPVHHLESAEERRNAIKSSVKPNCLFLDFAGNIRRHGFLDRIKGIDKDKKDPKDKEQEIKECPKCHTILEKSATICTECEYEFPQEVKRSLKVESGAHTGHVLAPDDDWKEKREVLAVSYHAHNVNKPGKTPCLRVEYLHPGAQRTKEYVFPYHPKSVWAFEKWWKKRTDISYPYTLDFVSILQDNCWDRLKKPSMIVVDTRDKFEKIIYHDFSKTREAKQDNRELFDIDDIPL